MGALFKSPTVPNQPTPATPAVGSASAATGGGAAQMAGEQRAAALQGGTVMSGALGPQKAATTTKTLIGQ